MHALINQPASKTHDWAVIKLALYATRPPLELPPTVNLLQATHLEIADQLVAQVELLHFIMCAEMNLQWAFTRECKQFDVSFARKLIRGVDFT